MPLLKDEPLRFAFVRRADQPHTQECQTMFSRFIRDDQGQDLIEYLLLGSFIAIVVLVGASNLGTELNNWYDTMGSWVNSAAGQIT